jgi:hypothetical protein
MRIIRVDFPTRFFYFLGFIDYLLKMLVCVCVCVCVLIFIVFTERSSLSRKF